jgi:transcriptional antiterminator
MVREYILTSREREILQRFLEKSEKLNGFSSLIYYLKRSRKTLETDLKLINETLQKLGEG